MSDLDLLEDHERNLLRAIASSQSITTPTELARKLGTSWQAVARSARGLKSMGMIKIRRLPNDRHPKMTIYELAPGGTAAWAEIQAIAAAEATKAFADLVDVERRVAAVHGLAGQLRAAAADDVPADAMVVTRDTDGTALRGPTLPCGCPLDSGCDGQHPGRL